MKRVLVTGATGYLAANLIPQLRYANYEVICLSRTGSQFPSIPTAKDIENVTGDIRKYDIWQQILPRVDTIFHLAGQTSLYVAEEQPIIDWENNVLPMLQLLEACKKNGLNKKIVFAGTSTQVGMPKHIPITQEHPDLPITIYDMHKCMAEKYLELYSRIGIVRGCTLRLTNVYGSGVGSNTPDRGILNRMICKALHGEEITVYGDGGYFRDYIFIEDVINAFIMAEEFIDRLIGKHFIVGSGEKNTIIDAFKLVADRVFKKTGIHVPISNVDIPENVSEIELRNFVADTSAYSNATGWRAAFTLQDGIDKTIDALIPIAS